MATPAPPRWDYAMQQRLARGEAAALGELYDRFASLVHSLAYRIIGDEDAADEITRDVFCQIWQNPDAYDPRDGNMRSWIATLTQRRSERWLRAYDDAEAAGGEPPAGTLETRIREARTTARADFIRDSMPPSIRAAINQAYLQRHDYRQAAEELGLSELEARRRMRLGLQMLATAIEQAPGAAGTTGGAR